MCYHLIPSDSNYYRFLGIIGSGAFGTVHKGIWHHSKVESNHLVEKEVAVKSIKDVNNEEESCKFLQEAAIMGQFKHANIIHMYGIIRTQQEVYLKLYLFLVTHVLFFILE